MGGYGRAVIDGTLQYTSPSAIDRADSGSPYGCLRAWWYRYVLRIKEPQRPSASKGDEIHSRIASYLETGVNALTSIEIAAKEFMPSPGKCAVELDIGDSMPLVLEGVRVVGKIDALREGPLYVTDYGETLKDPDQTIEVLDWKSTGDIKKAKAPVTTPMMVYGAWACRRTGATWVRLSHVYMQTRGAPRATKTTKLFRGSDLLKRLQTLTPIVQSMKSAARTDNVKDVDHTTDPAKCARCFYRDKCPQGQSQSLASVFGTSAAANLLRKGTEKMGLLDQLNAGQQQAAEDLQLAEQVARFGRAWDSVCVHNKGRPSLNAQVAQLWSKHKGAEVKPGAGLAGSGELGKIQLSSLEALEQLAGECASAFGSAPLVSPETPVSDPALATAGPPEVTEPPPENAEAAKPEGPPDDLRKQFSKMKKPELVDELVRVMSSGGGGGSGPAPVTGDGIRLFVNCAVMQEAKPLGPYVDELCRKLCGEFGAEDIRCAPQDGPLGFGRWKGALAATAREMPPQPGDYVLHAHGDEVSEIVATALAPACALYVRGY